MVPRIQAQFEVVPLDVRMQDQSFNVHRNLGSVANDKQKYRPEDGQNTWKLFEHVRRSFLLIAQLSDGDILKRTCDDPG